MAILNVTLNLLSNNSIKKVVGDTGVLNTALGKTKGLLDDVNGRMKALQSIRGLAALSTVIRNMSLGVKSIADGFENIVLKFENYANSGDRIAKTSRLVGLSVKSYQALSSAALDSGMSIEEMDSALKKFNVNLSKARSGDKTMLGNFSKVLFGKDSDLKGLNRIKSTSDVLVALADSYSRLSSAEQKAFVSSEIFGKSGLKMSEILSQGGQSLKKFLDSYEKGFTDRRHGRHGRLPHPRAALARLRRGRALA